jgi:hypothetical protein
MLNRIGNLSANTYLVWGSTGVAISATHFVTITSGGGTPCATNCIQNGSSDGFALINGSTLFGLYSYEGTLTYSSTTSLDIDCTDSAVTGDTNYSCNNGPTAGHTDWYTSTNITYGNPGPSAVSVVNLSVTPELSLAGLMGSSLILTLGVFFISKHRQ